MWYIIYNFVLMKNDTIVSSSSSNEVHPSVILSIIELVSVIISYDVYHNDVDMFYVLW
jgi:hypothetical protein